MRKALTNRKIMVGYDEMRTNTPEAITGRIPPGLDLDCIYVSFPAVAQEAKRSQWH